MPPTVASSGWHSVVLTGGASGSQSKAAGGSSRAAVAIVTAARDVASPAAFLSAGGALSYGNVPLVKVGGSSAVAQNTVGTTRWRRVEFFFLDDITARSDDTFRWTAPSDASDWVLSVAVLDHTEAVVIRDTGTYVINGGSGTGATNSSVVLSASDACLGLVASLCDNIVANKAGQTTIASRFLGFHHSMQSSEASVTSDTLGHTRSISGSGPWVAGGLLLGSAVQSQLIISSPLTWEWEFAEGIDLDTLSPGPTVVAVEQPLRYRWDFADGIGISVAGARRVMLGGGSETTELTELPTGDGPHVLRWNTDGKAAFEDLATLVGNLGGTRHTDLAVSGAHTIDRADGENHILALTGTTAFTLAGAFSGDKTTDTRVFLYPDGNDVTWTNVTWPNGEPDLSAALVVLGFTTPDNGTTWLGFVAEPGGGGNPPAEDTAAWMPLTSVDGGEPVFVWDDDDSLIPTLVPLGG